MRLDALKQRAAAGDERAVEILLRLVPNEIPASLLRRERDSEIRRVAAELRSARPGMTHRGAALALAQAGRACETGSRPAGAAFDHMLRADLDRLLAEIGDILAWAPATKHGARWPCLRSIISIIRE